MPTNYENLSSDVLWECARTSSPWSQLATKDPTTNRQVILNTGKNNAFLCKRKQAGGVQFSRDPFNLVNKHSRKYEGFVNDKAIGINADSNTVRLSLSSPS